MHCTFLQMCILFVALWWQPLLAQQVFTDDEIKEDITYLKSQLIRYHPNLYLYSKQHEFNAFTDQLKTNVSKETTTLEAYRMFSSYSQVIRDGHTSIRPSKSVFEDYKKDTTLFPIRVYWDGTMLNSIMDYSREDTLPNGSAILSINGIPSEEIVGNILNTLQHDGDNKTYPTWILNNFFTAYYTFYYGGSEIYKITYKDSSSKVQELALKGLPKYEISARRKERYPAYAEQLRAEKKTGILLDTLPNSSAILTIKSFDNGILLKTYHQRFRSSIRKAIRQIRTDGIETLVIDVRGNQGGHLTNGHFLLKRLMRHRYIMVECFTKVKKKCSHVANARNKPSYGPILGIKKPNKKRFEGELYFLVDGGSFSCSGIVTHVIKSYGRGTIVGEETGGSAYSLVGSPNKNITLPNTGIKVTIPRLQFILQDLKTPEKSGTFPDVVLSSTYTDLLEGKDAALEYVLSRIQEQQVLPK